MLVFTGYCSHVSSHRENVCSEIGQYAKRGNIVLYTVRFIMRMFTFQNALCVVVYFILSNPALTASMRSVL